MPARGNASSAIMHHAAIRPKSASTQPGVCQPSIWKRSSLEASPIFFVIARRFWRGFRCRWTARKCNGCSTALSKSTLSCIPKTPVAAASLGSGHTRRCRQGPIIIRPKLDMLVDDTIEFNTRTIPSSPESRERASAQRSWFRHRERGDHKARRFTIVWIATPHRCRNWSKHRLTTPRRSRPRRLHMDYFARLVRSLSGARHYQRHPRRTAAQDAHSPTPGATFEPTDQLERAASTAGFAIS